MFPNVPMFSKKEKNIVLTGKKGIFPLGKNPRFMFPSGYALGKQRSLWFLPLGKKHFIDQLINSY